MRVLVTGVDADGRSCGHFQDPGAFAASSAPIAVRELYATATGPLPPRPPGSAQLIDLGLAPGQVRWIVVDYEAGAATPHHHTDTWEFEVVLSGSVDLTLDDGVHHLHLGDCVVMTGVDHSWTAGPEGCRLSVLSIGTPPPD
jgi:quercetin dioxygenase-like cupin family protein